MEPRVNTMRLLLHRVCLSTAGSLGVTCLVGTSQAQAQAPAAAAYRRTSQANASGRAGCTYESAVTHQHTPMAKCMICVERQDPFLHLSPNTGCAPQVSAPPFPCGECRGFSSPNSVAKFAHMSPVTACFCAAAINNCKIRGMPIRTSPHREATPVPGPSPVRVVRHGPGQLAELD